MESLNLDGLAVIDPSEELRLKSAYDIIDEIDQHLEEKMGVEPLPRPKREAPDLSELTDRADDLTDQELATYLALFTQWASFFDHRLSVVTASHKLAERNRKLMDSELSLKLYTEDIPKTEVPQRIRQHALHVKFETEELTLYCMKQILAARYKAYSKQADVISRLITLREQELERQRIQANLGKRGRRGSPVRKRFNE